MSAPDRVHDYVNERGDLLFQVVRRQTPEGKRMFARRPDPEHPGEFLWSLDGIEERPLYWLPHVLDAVARGEQVHLVAGEKVADAMYALGYTATTNPFGESGDLKPEQVDALRGARVVLWVDSDTPGRTRGERAIDQLREVVAELRGPIDLAPERDDGYDLADAIDQMRADGVTDEDLLLRIGGYVERAERVEVGPLAVVVDLHGDAHDPASIVIEDLCESVEHETEPVWLWDGYVAEGWVSLIVGPPKVGKTTVLCGLFDAFRRGEPLIGQGTRKVRTLLLTEQASGTFRETMANFGFRVDPGDVAVMYRWRQPPALDWPQLIDQAVNAAIRDGRKLVVVDTFARWASMRHDHDATEILRCLEPLNRAAQAGLAILIVHHARKTGGSHGVEVSGRAEIAGQVDVILSLRRAGENRKIVGDGRSMQTPSEVAFSASSEGLARVDIKDAQTDAVLAALTELGDATTYDLMDATELPRTNVRRALDALLERGDARDAGTRGRARLFSC